MTPRPRPSAAHPHGCAPSVSAGVLASRGALCSVQSLAPLTPITTSTSPAVSTLRTAERVRATGICTKISAHPAATSRVRSGSPPRYPSGFVRCALALGAPVARCLGGPFKSVTQFTDRTVSAAHNRTMNIQDTNPGKRLFVLALPFPIPTHHGFAVAMLTIVALIAAGIVYRMFFSESAKREVF